MNQHTHPCASLGCCKCAIRHSSTYLRVGWADANTSTAEPHLDPALASTGKFVLGSAGGGGWWEKGGEGAFGGKDEGTGNVWDQEQGQLCTPYPTPLPNPTVQHGASQICASHTAGMNSRSPIGVKNIPFPRAA